MNAPQHPTWRTMLYSLLLYCLAPVIWSYLIFRAIRAPEYREGFQERLGLLPDETVKGGILVHCASVGEVRAAAPLIRRLISDYPDLTITITSTTPTGKKAASELFGNSIQQAYLPIDWPGSCRRFLADLSPKVVVLMETELWLNLLRRSQKMGIPVLLANARLSNNSLAKYQKYQGFSQLLFQQVSQIGAQYELDKKNFLALGVTENQITVTGSIKFDVSVSSSLAEQQRKLKFEWGTGRPIWIAVSIHPGEFDQILKAHKKLLSHIPELLLIAVPRHPERFEELKQRCQTSGLSFVSRSEDQVPDANTQVVVGDTMGEILLLCGVADLAFVGGSLIDRGGHNPLSHWHATTDSDGRELL